MPRLALEIVRVPEGVSVRTPDGSSRVACEPGEHFFVGRSEDCEVCVSGAEPAMAALVADGFGGVRTMRFRCELDGRWEVDHLGHDGFISVNGHGVGHRQALAVGDRVSPGGGLLFTLIDLDAPSRLEPPELLDAVAEAPADEARWHVLADWLIEQQAPHALLAAYELKLKDGTNDPDLLGEYAATRRRRHTLLDDLWVDDVVWKCGYVVRCSLWLGPRDYGERVRLTHALSAPQFAALSELVLQCNGTESAARLEVVLHALPRTVRTVGLHFAGPVSFSALQALHARPPKAHTVRLHLSDPIANLTALVDLLVASGWKTIDFESTRLTDRSSELLESCRRHGSTRFLLGGTSLASGSVLRLARENVGWSGPDHDALLIDRRTGAVWPVSRTRRGSARGLSLTPLGNGWTTPNRAELLSSGDRFTAGDREYVFLSGSTLDALYLEWLRTSGR